MKEPGKGFYYHYKQGDVSEVIGIAFHSETREKFVTYRHITGEHAGEQNYWVRPIQMFMENVTKDGQTLPRFRKITDPKIISELEKIRDEMYG